MRCDRLWQWFIAVDGDRSGQISAPELRKCRHIMLSTRLNILSMQKKPSSTAIGLVGYLFVNLNEWLLIVASAFDLDTVKLLMTIFVCRIFCSRMQVAERTSKDTDRSGTIGFNEVRSRFSTQCSSHSESLFSLPVYGNISRQIPHSTVLVIGPSSYTCSGLAKCL